MLFTSQSRAEHVAYAAKKAGKAMGGMAKKVGGWIATGAEFLWDAYMRGYNLQQNAQMQEVQMMLDGTMQIYGFLDENEVISAGKVGSHSVQATIAAKKAWAYFVMPVPTPIDEAFAIGFGLKAIYHLFVSLDEVR